MHDNADTERLKATASNINETRCIRKGAPCFVLPCPITKINTKTVGNVNVNFTM